MKWLYTLSACSKKNLQVYSHAGLLLFLLLMATAPVFSGESAFQRTGYSAAAGLQGRVVLDVSAGSYLELAKEEIKTDSNPGISETQDRSLSQGFSTCMRINVVTAHAWQASISFPVKFSIPSAQGSTYPQVRSLISISQLSGKGIEGLRKGLDFDAVSLFRLVLEKSGTTPDKGSLSPLAVESAYFKKTGGSGTAPVFGEAAVNESSALWIIKNMISDPVILSGSLRIGAGKGINNYWNGGFRLGIEFAEALNQRIALKIEAANAVTWTHEPGGLRCAGSKIEAGFSVVWAGDTGLREAGITMSLSESGASAGCTLGYSGLTRR